MHEPVFWDFTSTHLNRLHAMFDTQRLRATTPNIRSTYKCGAYVWSPSAMASTAEVYMHILEYRQSLAPYRSPSSISAYLYNPCADPSCFRINFQPSHTRLRAYTNEFISLIEDLWHAGSPVFHAMNVNTMRATAAA